MQALAEIDALLRQQELAEPPADDVLNDDPPDEPQVLAPLELELEEPATLQSGPPACC